MPSNVDWDGILVPLVLGLILIGPEWLPKVIENVCALLLATRTTINNVCNSLSGEFGEDFDDLCKPLQELNDLRRLSPKTVITGTLFDGDDTYLDMLFGKPVVGDGGASATGAMSAVGAVGAVGQQYQQPNTNQPVQPTLSQQPAP